MRRHPLLAYFALSYTVTWLAWLPYILSRNGIGALPFRVPDVLGSSQTLGILPGAYLGPVLAAFVVTAVADGRAGLRRWAARLVRWRVSVRWYLAVLFAVPAVCVLATLPLGVLPRVPSLGVLAAYLPLLVLQFLTTGVAEEPGWRDFAQPRLQARYGPLAGSLILGPLWGAWHLPLFLTEWAGWPDVDWAMAAEFIGGAVLLSVVMTWVFNRTGESLPLIMLFHANVNTVFSLLWAEMFPSLDAFADSLHALAIGAGAAAVILVVTTRGRLGAPARPAT
ncbi:CPBP family intramembrane glutamic endopeptidase [Virgisporangium aliadipatigenens]|uniref:CPBP family intramembrane glutamic endopeptidase n=1 Tax=Virgisporangium aliadipatigenens TaxID=741659 RepID=UPI001944F354|nr:CPBP family intramembrane glutamic endopeptidase [Virgisporangium aliadipatigenens]